MARLWNFSEPGLTWWNALWTEVGGIRTANGTYHTMCLSRTDLPDGMHSVVEFHLQDQVPPMGLIVPYFYLSLTDLTACTLYWSCRSTYHHLSVLSGVLIDAVQMVMGSFLEFPSTDKLAGQSPGEEGTSLELVGLFKATFTISGKYTQVGYPFFNFIIGNNGFPLKVIWIVIVC